MVTIEVGKKEEKCCFLLAGVGWGVCATRGGDSVRVWGAGAYLYYTIHILLGEKHGLSHGLSLSIPSY